MLYADDAGVYLEAGGMNDLLERQQSSCLSRSSVGEEEGTHAVTKLLQTRDQTPPAPPLAIEAAGQRYRQTTQ